MRAARKLLAVSSAPVLGQVVVTQLNSMIHIQVTLGRLSRALLGTIDVDAVMA